MSGDKSFTRAHNASSDTANRHQRQNPTSKSNMQLNAEAPEWYPANHKRNPNAQASAAGSRTGEKYIAPCCRRQFRTLATIVTKSQPVLNVGKDFSYLKRMVAKITYDPGQFEVVIDMLIQTLKPHFLNGDMMASIAAYILGHAIEEPSFRYNAGRLSVLIQKDSPLFEAHLENLCLLEVERSVHRPGFSLFMAELFTQSRNGNWKILYKALNKLVLFGGDNGVKTVCQALKLAGRCLEEFNKTMMDSLIKALELQKKSVHKTIYVSLIESVLKLRINKWGQVEAETASKGATSRAYNPYASQAKSLPNGKARKPSSTFYGPSGVELTEADRRFMNEAYDEPEEPFDRGDGMDAEIQEAFEELVKMRK